MYENQILRQTFRRLAALARGVYEKLEQVSELKGRKIQRFWTVSRTFFNVMLSVNGKKESESCGYLNSRHGTSGSEGPVGR
jgi:hypothetical protein